MCKIIFFYLSKKKFDKFLLSGVKQQPSRGNSEIASVDTPLPSIHPGENTVHRIVLDTVLLAIVLVAPFTALAASISDVDVAGMKLGMSVAEIEEAAARHGLTIDYRGPGPSFAQRVAIAQGERVAGKDYAAVRELRLVSETEDIQVRFVATPQGEKVYYVTRMLLDRSLKPDALGARFEKQYGEPDIKRDKEWVWGDTSYYASDRVAPYLELRIRPMTRSKSMKRPVVQLTLTDPTIPKRIRAAVNAEN